MYAVNTEDGYIHSVVKGVSFENSNISKEEYLHIKNMLGNSPKAPDGYIFRLTEALQWERLPDEIAEIREP